jgi:hypothetical protein
LENCRNEAPARPVLAPAFSRLAGSRKTGLSRRKRLKPLSLAPPVHSGPAPPAMAHRYKDAAEP